MKIRDHEPSPRGPYCRWCGAYSLNGQFSSEATCNEREVSHQVMRPAPSRRQYAFDDADVISANINRIRTAEQQRCPLSADRLLHECLRSSAQCGDACPFKADWIGPHHD